MPTASRNLAESTSSRAVAINVGANSTLPGIRGRLWPDGSFEYIPIPEREPTDEPVPTYGDLGVEIPSDLRDVGVHLDPAFAKYPECSTYTYGDEHAVKANPLASLQAGDFVWFYASLRPVEGGPSWAPPAWGAFIIGEFCLEVDPIDPERLSSEPVSIRRRCRQNAHFRRVDPDARVILVGDPASSQLLGRPLPLSTPEAGSNPNAFVTVYSSDSGAGPWWRRVLRFSPEATSTVRDHLHGGPPHPP